MPPRYCECGRKIVIAVNRAKSPNASKKARRSDGDHGHCRQCFERERTKMMMKWSRPKGGRHERAD